jgi:hypothetical protein
MPNWETDAEGFIIFHPLVGHEAALLAQTGCGVRLEFADHPDDIGKSSKFLVLAMTPRQALALADDLRELARRATTRPQGTIPNYFAAALRATHAVRQ